MVIIFVIDSLLSFQQDYDSKKLKIKTYNKNIYKNGFPNTLPNQSNILTRNHNITLTSNPKVILCFPFHHEFPVLHMKFLLLEPYVDLFVLVESKYDDRGEKKPLHFELNKFQPDYEKHISSQKVIHLLNTFEPKTKDKELGWLMTKSAKEMLGKFIVYNLSKEYSLDTIILLGDADEIPSPQSIEWLKLNAVNQHSQDVYEFASSMPTFMYGFVWMHSPNGYSTLTARSMKNEISFWKSIFEPNIQREFTQNILPIPLYPSGWHCSYCFSSQSCVEKLKHANLADGPPYLGLFEWTPYIFDLYRSCGVAPQGNPLLSVFETFPLENLNSSILVQFTQNVEIMMKYNYLFEVQNCSSSDQSQIQKQIPIIQKATF